MKQLTFEKFGIKVKTSPNKKRRKISYWQKIVEEEK